MRPRDIALALLVVVLWGVNFVVIKVALRGVSPFVLGGLRFVLAALPAVLFVPRPRVPLRLYVGFALTTFIGQFALLFWAIKVGMPSGLSSVVHQSQAFITVLLAAAVFGEKPDRAQLAGMAVAAAGLCWIGAASGSSFPLAAFALNLCASACWAAGNLVSRSLSRQGPVNGLAFVVWASLTGPGGRPDRGHGGARRTADRSAARGERAGRDGIGGAGGLRPMEAPLLNLEMLPGAALRVVTSKRRP